MSRTFDIEAEYSVLAGLMVWPDTMDHCAGLEARHFHAAENREVYVGIQSLVISCQAVDPITVLDACKARDRATELTLSSVNAIAQAAQSRASVKRCAQIILERAAERELLKAADEAAEIAQGDDDAATKLEQITALFMAIASKAVRKAPRDIGDVMASRLDHYTALSEGTQPRGWSTGIHGFDRLMNGGLRPGKVYVLAARPKVGKSSLAQQIAMHLASDGLPALILSQEMEATEPVDRAIANKGRVNYSGLMTGDRDDEQWGRLAEGADVVARLPLWLDDQAALTLGDIRTKARGVKGLKLLVIDYLQLCSGSGRKGDNRNTEIEEISRGVKALAKDLGIAVLMLSQLNREVEKRASKRPNLSHLRDSGSIEQDADAVIFLWPARDFDAPGHRLIGCAVDANRSGACGEFALDFQGNHQLWRESTESLAQPARSFAANRKGYEE